MLNTTDPPLGVAPKQNKEPQFRNRTGRKIQQGELVVFDFRMQEATTWLHQNPESVWATVVNPQSGDDRYGWWLVAVDTPADQERGRFAIYGVRLRVLLDTPVQNAGVQIWAPEEGPHATLEPRAGAKCLGWTAGAGESPVCAFSGKDPLWGYFTPDFEP